jgi:hypothetical protein
MPQAVHTASANLTWLSLATTKQHPSKNSNRHLFASHVYD